MRFTTSLAAFAALAGLTSAIPNGWSKTKSAEDGPKKLDECGCWPIYQAILRCQKLKGPNSGTDDCVCIPNPDGWYGSMDGCRNCLAPGSYEDNDFFDNMSRLVTQLFVSCTNAGGGVRSDGTSLCASNYYREACVSLGTGGKPSWASFEVFEEGTKGNGSYVLDIAEFGADESSSSTGTAAASKTKTTAATATISEDSTTTTTETSATTTSTGEPAATTDNTSNEASGTEAAPASSTSPSSAMGFAGSRATAGQLAGLVVAMVVAGAVF